MPCLSTCMHYSPSIPRQERTVNVRSVSGWRRDPDTLPDREIIKQPRGYICLWTDVPGCCWGFTFTPWRWPIKIVLQNASSVRGIELKISICLCYLFMSAIGTIFIVSNTIIIYNLLEIFHAINLIFELCNAAPTRCTFRATIWQGAMNLF